MARDRWPGEPTEPVELIDPLFGERSEASSEVVRSGPGDRTGLTRMALLGGVVAVVAMLLVLGRAGPEAGLGQLGDGELVEDLVDGGQPGDTRGGASTGAQAVAPTTSIPGAMPADRVDTSPSSVVAPAPMLGQRSGLSLFYGGDGPLQVVDLDTGTLTRYGLVAHPVLTTGADLVLYQEETGVVGWVPLDNPGQQALTWKRGLVAAGTGPGLLWILDPEYVGSTPVPGGDPDEDADDGADGGGPADAGVGSGRWELFETPGNRLVVRIPADLHAEVEEVEAAQQPLGGAIQAVRPGPFFSTRPDGVYLAIEGGFQRVASGRLVAHDWATALVGDCPPDGGCDLSWIDAETGERVDRPVPQVRPRVANLVAGGTWLHSVDWEGTSELLELATGRRIEHVWATDRPTLSPDGRWLAEWFGTTVVLSDLDGDGPPRTVSWIEAFDGDGPGSLLFAATPVVVAE